MMPHGTCKDQLFDFLNKGASPFHAVQQAEAFLTMHGATYLPEQSPWALAAGELYYTKRNGSSIIAFCTPSTTLQGYRAAASHSDAPTWRIKNISGTDGMYAKVEVEGYGGMIVSTWLDRPLTLAGRVMVRTQGDANTPTRIESRLIAPKKALFCIPNVAIHLNRKINDGYTYNPQVDLQPLFGAKGADLHAFLREELALREEQTILAHDLVLCPVQEAVTLGVADDLFMSARIDDLACAYATLAAFVEPRVLAHSPAFYAAAEHAAFNDAPCAHEQGGFCNIWAMFDNEEVGSSSRQGAEGSFLPDVLARIEAALGLSVDAAAAARANSMLLSADNAHATHPNHPELSDPLYPVVLGKGVVIKYNANQKYTTNAFSGAYFEEICTRAHVPTQTFYNRADMAGGSTLGNLLSHQIAFPMVDIGVPQLAMHSAMETANLADVEAMVRAVGAFYAQPFRISGDDAWVCAL